MTKGYFLWELNIEVNREVSSKYLFSLANGTPQVTDKHKPLVNAILRDSHEKTYRSPEIPIIPVVF
ncbi:hypothetical protein ES703_33497 [subsurface metagenome]